MQLGIFAKTFPGSDPAARARGGARRRLCASPSSTSPAPACRRCRMRCRPKPSRAIRAASEATGVALAALSGTYNMAHPDKAVRDDGLRRLGSRHRGRGGACHSAGHALHRHPQPPTTSGRIIPTMPIPRPGPTWRPRWKRRWSSPSATASISASSPNRPTSSPRPTDAMRLIAEMGSKRLRIVLDPANLFEQATPDEARAIVAAAIEISGRPCRHGPRQGPLRRRPLRHRRPGRRRLRGFRRPAARHRLRRPAGDAWPFGRRSTRRRPLPEGAALMARPTTLLPRRRRASGLRHGRRARRSSSSTASAATRRRSRRSFPTAPAAGAHRSSAAGTAARRSAAAGRFRFAMFADDVLAAADAGRPRPFRRRRHLDGRGDRAAPRLPSPGPRRRPGAGAPGLDLRRRAGEHAADRARSPASSSTMPLTRRATSSRNRQPPPASQREAPDNLASLLGYFDRPDAAAVRATSSPTSPPTDPAFRESDAAALDVPDARHRQRPDAVHPLATAHTLADRHPRRDTSPR